MSEELVYTDAPLWYEPTGPPPPPTRLGPRVHVSRHLRYLFNSGWKLTRIKPESAQFVGSHGVIFQNFEDPFLGKEVGPEIVRGRTWAAGVFTGEAGFLLISEHFATAERALNEMRRVVLALGGPDPADEVAHLPWDLSLRQRLVYGPELYYLLCEIRSRCEAEYVAHWKPSKDAWHSYWADTDPGSAIEKAWESKEWEKTKHETLERVRASPGFAEADGPCGVCPHCRMVGFSGVAFPDQSLSCYRGLRRMGGSQKTELRTVALARAERAFRERMERKRRAEHALEPQLPACPLPPWGCWRRAICKAWTQGTPEPCIEWRGDASVFSTRLRPQWARYQFKRATDAASLQENALVYQLLSQDWGQFHRGQADIEPRCRPWSLSQHAEVLEAVKGAAARHEPAAEIAVLPVKIADLRGPLDPTPDPELAGDNLPCFYCRGYHKRTRRHNMRHFPRVPFKHGAPPLGLLAITCPVIVTYMATWVIPKDPAVEPPFRPSNEKHFRASVYQPLTMPIPWLPEIRPATKDLMRSFKETMTAAVDDFDRPDLHLRLTPDALLAAGLLLEEMADENIAALGQL